MVPSQLPSTIADMYWLHLHLWQGEEVWRRFVLEDGYIHYLTSECKFLSSLCHTQSLACVRLWKSKEDIMKVLGVLMSNVHNPAAVLRRCTQMSYTIIASTYLGLAYGRYTVNMWRNNTGCSRLQGQRHNARQLGQKIVTAYLTSAMG